MGTILLTSQGFYNDKITNKFKELTSNLLDYPAIIITTACEDRNNNKWAIKAKNQLLEIGYKKVDLVDLEEDNLPDFSLYKTIYVAGGNGFRLASAVRKTNFKKVIIECINNEGVYIGVSAGSILLSPSILLEAVFEPEKIPSNFNDFSGLGIVPTIIMPHYQENFEPKILNFEKNHGLNITRITDNDFVLYSDFKFDLSIE